MADILIFGASNSYGAWDIEGGWVQRIRKFKDKENIINLPNFILIYNLSISGNTTEDILDRFDAEIRAHLKETKKAHAIIFSIGANDSRKINGKYAVSPEKFRQNIVELIKRAKKHTRTIVFVSPKPIHPDFVQWSKTETYELKDIKNYKDIIKLVCKENKVHFVDLFDELKKLEYPKLLQDELHYNTKGHQKIFEIVEEFLIENKII